MNNALSKFVNDPVRFVKAAFMKLFVNTLRYRNKDGYDAARYWEERFLKHGNALKGVGDEGLSEEENRSMYDEAGRVFLEIIKRQAVDLKNGRILEIGCGNGFYTRALKELGAVKYTGLDITDVLFDRLRKEFPGFDFVRKDVTAGRIDGQYDLIVMIDVIEHIVNGSKFNAAMANIRNAVAGNGLFVVAPVMGTSRRHLVHVRFWAMEDIKRNFPGFHFEEPVPFRNGLLLPIKNI